MIPEIEKMIYGALGYKPPEKIALLHDNTYEPIMNLLEQNLRLAQIPCVKVNFTHSYNTPLEENIRELFLNPEFNILVLGFNQNIWHTPERKSAKYDLGKRIINLIHPEGICNSFNANITQLKNRGTALFSHLKEGAKVEIYTAKGTALETTIYKAFLESGDYSQPYSGGDFPSGEVGFSPVIGSTKGTLVLDYKIQHVGFVDKEPPILNIKNDEINIVKGSQQYKQLITSHNSLKYICEISIGTNPIHANEQNIHSIVEEKNLGTMHFGCGGNGSYGLRKGPHFDSVIQEPTLIVNGKLLMEKGQFRVCPKSLTF
ncbi:hypothetical protein K9M74_05505 [Candidatus Woesearchaeota archaeon]|nr:hypothetical protein [Candidatus Woesearchaeota archaeon]